MIEDSDDELLTGKITRSGASLRPSVNNKQIESKRDESGDDENSVDSQPSQNGYSKSGSVSRARDFDVGELIEACEFYSKKMAKMLDQCQDQTTTSTTPIPPSSSTSSTSSSSSSTSSSSALNDEAHQ